MWGMSDKFKSHTLNTNQSRMESTTYARIVELSALKQILKEVNCEVKKQQQKQNMKSGKYNKDCVLKARSDSTL